MSIDVNLHIDPITLNVVLVRPPTIPPGTARAAFLTIGGLIMAGPTPGVTLSIDDTTGVASVKFVDDKGDTDAAPPAAYVPAFASDNLAVLTIDPASGLITPLAEGVANVSAPVADANGVPVPLPDGSGNFATQAVAVTIGPGLAIAAVEAVTP